MIVADQIIFSFPSIHKLRTPQAWLTLNETMNFLFLKFLAGTFFQEIKKYIFKTQ